MDLQLDAELCTLEQELSRLDTDLRSMQDMEKYWKETAKRTFTVVKLILLCVIIKTLANFGFYFLFSSRNRAE
ncbi:hypothetical protein PHET_12148 [Paragonimus heterotremus]|uniref:Uncharacterized protein n=1 Tax=Paragonimus heterotremus TaxID=100268 RepID=A0A8J4SY44_9TREM|nr:hypothetical protein PHET_12148 [Paragonimus heterotremus]